MTARLLEQKEREEARLTARRLKAESKLKALRGMLGIDEEQAGRWAAEANAKRMLDSMSV